MAYMAVLPVPVDDAMMGFQDLGPALSSMPIRALLSTLHPSAIILPVHLPIRLQRSCKGKGIPIWNLAIVTSVVASEGPAEGIGQVHTHPGSERMSILSPEGFGLALLLFFRNSQQ